MSTFFLLLYCHCQTPSLHKRAARLKEGDTVLRDGEEAQQCTVGHLTGGHLTRQPNDA